MFIRIIRNKKTRTSIAVATFKSHALEIQFCKVLTKVVCPSLMGLDIDDLLGNLN